MIFQTKIKRKMYRKVTHLNIKTYLLTLKNKNKNKTLCLNFYTIKYTMMQFTLFKNTALKNQMFGT